MKYKLWSTSKEKNRNVVEYSLNSVWKGVGDMMMILVRLLLEKSRIVCSEMNEMNRRSIKKERKEGEGR